MEKVNRGTFISSSLKEQRVYLLYQFFPQFICVQQ